MYICEEQKWDLEREVRKRDWEVQINLKRVAQCEFLIIIIVLVIYHVLSLSIQIIYTTHMGVYGCCALWRRESRETAGAYLLSTNLPSLTVEAADLMYKITTIYVRNALVCPKYASRFYTFFFYSVALKNSVHKPEDTPSVLRFKDRNRPLT